MNPNDVVATVGWILLVAGWLSRRDRRRHLTFVIPGMTLDLGLVLWLELSRHVIEQVMGQPVPDQAPRTYDTLERLHIASSTAAVALYLPTIWLGIRLIRRRGGAGTRTWHRRCATTALAFRTIGFAFMWCV